MLIEDPNLYESAYTKLLNKKCPQRKYLKHNLSSWLRFKQIKNQQNSKEKEKSKENSKEKSKEREKESSKEKDFHKNYYSNQNQNQKLSPKFFQKNKKAKYSDFNLREINSNKDINISKENISAVNQQTLESDIYNYNYNNKEKEKEKITDIKKAQELIESLKQKLIEYETINNKNIEVSFDLVEKIKHENEFYKQKLLNIYDELNFYKEKYDDDILETNGLYDHKRYLVKSLRTKWLKFKFFYGLKNRIEEIKKMKNFFFDFQQNKNYFLIFKGFLGLEKNRLNEKEVKKFREKIENKNKKNILKSLWINLDEKKRHRKYKEIKKSISLILSFKNFRYNLSLRKYYNELNKKALFKYYLKTSRKIFLALRQNILTRSSTMKYKKKFEDSKKINFTNFFKNLKNLNSLDNNERISKTKGITFLKKLFEIKNYKLQIKYKTQEFGNYYVDCFKEWKEKALYPIKVKTFMYILRIKLMQLFFRRVKNLIKIKLKKQTFMSSMFSPKNTYRNNLNNFSQENFNNVCDENNNNNNNTLTNEKSLFSSNYNSYRNSRKSFFNTFFKNCINIIKKRTTNKFQKFFEFSRDLYYTKFLNELKAFYYFNPNIRYKKISKKLKFSNFFEKIKNLIQKKNQIKIGSEIFKNLQNLENPQNLQNSKNSNTKNFFRILIERIVEQKIKILLSSEIEINYEKNNKKNKNQKKIEISEKILFENLTKFFKILTYRIKVKKILMEKTKKFHKNFLIKNLKEKFFRKILLKKIFSKKNLIEYSENLNNIKMIIEEKSEIIKNIQQENLELRKHYEIARKETKAKNQINEKLEEKLKILEAKINNENNNFKEIFDKNINDIKSKKKIYYFLIFFNFYIK
jgi:hypothetical protein